MFHDFGKRDTYLEKTERILIPLKMSSDGYAKILRKMSQVSYILCSKLLRQLQGIVDCKNMDERFEYIRLCFFLFFVFVVYLTSKFVLAKILE